MSVRILLAITILVIAFPFVVFLRTVEADSKAPSLIVVSHCKKPVLFIGYMNGKVSLATPNDLANNPDLMGRFAEIASKSRVIPFPVEAVSGIGCPVQL
jgi:hypothetical protein